MTCWVVIGGQWGDEGKGKVVNLLTDGFDAVARYQGGHNAGHTIVLGSTRYALHLVPSGILASKKLCIIGNGVVLDLRALCKELASLKEAGVDVEGLKISDRAHLLLPQHAEIDIAREQALGVQKIGTTGRGIGPCYESKVMREGIPAAFLRNPTALEARVRELAHSKIAYMAKLFSSDGGMTIEDTVKVVQELAPTVLPHLTDASLLANRLMDEGKSLLLEGAQGTMLDLDHGTYPFVTSSSSAAGGACTGLGISPTRVDRVFAVMKAYCTRVGSGPFVTELDNDVGDAIRKRGNEYGTTTGRPRRCGWFDLVVARYTARINHLDGICLTLLDVLDEFDEISVCTAYRCASGRTEHYPAAPWELEGAAAEYETLPGWKQSTRGITRWEDLPKNAQAYVRKLEEWSGVKVALVSTGPEKTSTIILSDEMRARMGM